MYGHRLLRRMLQDRKGYEMNQHERILIYIRMHGSITPMDAFNDLGITKLATRISELKREGVKFEQDFESRENRFGEKVHYMRYRLKKE